MYRSIAALLATLASGLAPAGSQTMPPDPAPAMVRLPNGPYVVNTVSNVRYGPFPKNVLDVCSPVPRADQWQGPFPAMVFVHGGAWSGGDKAYHAPDCTFWASYGFVGVNINYRLQRGDDPSSWWPAQLIDSQATVRWVRFNAASLGVAASHVYAMGDSAGGQLVEYLGFQSSTVPGDLAGLYPRLSSHVQFVVAEWAPSHWGPALWQPDSPTRRTYDLVPANYSRTARTLLVQGSDDTIVWPSQSIDLYNELRAFGRPVEYLEFKGGHGFVGTSSSIITAVRIREINAAMAQAKYFKIMPDSVKGPVEP